MICIAVNVKESNSAWQKNQSCLSKASFEGIVDYFVLSSNESSALKEK